MKNILTVTKRELRSYFETPVAYVFLVIFLVLTGIFTFKLGNFYSRGQADLRPFFSWHIWLYLFFIPAVSMRLWSEEYRSDTIEIILTLPVTVAQAVLGKFLAAWIFTGLALLLTFPMMLTVWYLGNPDWGIIACSYLGSFLMAGAYLAVGSFFSACSRNQIVSFITTTVFCLFLVLIGFNPFISMLKMIVPNWFVEQIINFSFVTHFDNIQKGILQLRDFLYFGSLIMGFLAATTIIIQNKRIG